MFFSLLNDTRIRILAAASIVFSLAFLLFNLLKVGGYGFILDFNGIVLLPFAFSATLLAFLTWYKSHRRERTRQVWLALGTGLGLWTIAETMWAVQQTLLHEDLPFPSTADYFYIAGYIPLILALFLRFRSLVAIPTRVQRIGVIGAYGMILIASFFFVILPNFSTSSAVSLLEQILNIIYPVGDLVIMLGVVMVLLTLTGGMYTYPWMIIAIGFILMTGADLLFAFGTMHDLYAPGGQLSPLTIMIDYPYTMSYMFMALGIYIHGRLSRLF